MTKLVLIGCFLIGLIAVLAVKAGYTYYQESSFTPQLVSYQIDPPSQSVSGDIKDLSGDVKKFSRTSIEFEATKVGERVLLGEKIATGEDGKATVEFKDLAKIIFAPKSESSFVETIPDRFSIRQAQGIIAYESKEKPVSVRSMHMLLSLTGRARVNVDKENARIVIDIISGTATLAMMDNDNKTNKWDLKLGQRVIIDDETRSVILSHANP